MYEPVSLTEAAYGAQRRGIYRSRDSLPVATPLKKMSFSLPDTIRSSWKGGAHELSLQNHFFKKCVHQQWTAFQLPKVSSSVCDGRDKP